MRESRRIKTALMMARLTAVKTLAGFDFSFQPSLDRNRILTLAQLDSSTATRSSTSSPARTGNHLAWHSRRGGQATQRLLLYPRRHHRFAAKPSAKDACANAFVALAPRCSSSTRSLPAVVPAWQPVLPAGQCPLRKGAMILTSNRGFAEWPRLRRPGRRHGAARPTPPSRRLIQIEGRAISSASTPTSFRSASAPERRSPHQPRTATPSRPTTEKEPRSTRR